MLITLGSNSKTPHDFERVQYVTAVWAVSDQEKQFITVFTETCYKSDKT